MYGKKYDVFISYRRDGGESTAKMLRDQLAGLNYHVFFDVESLRSGDFNIALFSVIEECKDFLLILSPGSLDRCENENDWVRLEIEHALGNNLNVVPIMLRGFTFPDKLPQSIEAIRYKNGLEANYQFFDAFIQRLQTFLLSKPAKISKNRLYLAGGCAVLGIMAAVVLIFSLHRLILAFGQPTPVPPRETDAPVQTSSPVSQDIITSAETPALADAPVQTPSFTGQNASEPTQIPSSPTPDVSAAVQAAAADPSPEPADREVIFTDWNYLMPDVVSSDGEKWVLGNKSLKRTSISTITFLNTLADMPEGAWDVSGLKYTDSPVMAWATPIETDNGPERYALYIATEGNVGAMSCQRLFAYYEHLTQINFNHCFYTGESDNMSQMFYGCRLLKDLDLSDFCTEDVRDMSDMFGDCGRLANISFGDFHTENVEKMQNMFVNCKELTHLDLSGFRTGKVTNMYNMFGGCTSLETVDLSKFDTSRVENMRFMFNLCGALTELNLSSFSSERVEDTSWMFSNCNSLTELSLGGDFNAKQVKDMSNMFYQCNSIKELDLSTFTTDETTNMSSMFNQCTSLTKLDISNFLTDNVTDMSFMFNNCRALTEIELSHFKTGNVNNMGAMFQSCESLAKLNLHNFSNDKVTDMSFMFSSCSALTEIELSHFKTGNVNNMSAMFQGCHSLTSLNLSDFATDHVTDMSRMFFNCKSLRELDLSNFDMSSVTNKENMFTYAAISEEEAKLPQ